MTYEIFQSPGTELCEKEALIIEQRGVTSYRAKSFFDGKVRWGSGSVTFEYSNPGDNISLVDRGRQVEGEGM